MDLACTGEINVTLDNIKQRLRGTLFRGPTAPLDVFRRAAVLLPLLCEDGQLSLLFIRRTETVQDHKGQVSFPGGGVEARMIRMSSPLHYVKPGRRLESFLRIWLFWAA